MTTAAVTGASCKVSASLRLTAEPWPQTVLGGRAGKLWCFIGDLFKWLLYGPLGRTGRSQGKQTER